MAKFEQHNYPGSVGIQAEIYNAAGQKITAFTCADLDSLRRQRDALGAALSVPGRVADRAGEIVGAILGNSDVIGRRLEYAEAIALKREVDKAIADLERRCGR